MSPSDPAREILIIDDYPQLVEYLVNRLKAEGGYESRAASTGASGLAAIRDGFQGVVLLDVRLPDIGGLDLFAKIKEHNADLPVIFITAHASVDLAIEATRLGAFDFIQKGSDLLKRLLVSVKNAFDRLDMAEKLQRLTSQLSSLSEAGDFVTVSPRMQKVLKTLDSVVNSGVTVLIEGESGTGKELIARAVHTRGSRSKGPFVAVNCAGIPETLLESEMFGYEKGAFTGATARRTGKFEAANGGTLFLDEMGELPRTLQAKLLRVLQDHCFERVGGNEPVSVDVRVVAATNRDLMSEVKNGNFREDLFYRLSVFPVRLPPLRDRPEDIPVLAQHFLRRFALEENKRIVGFEGAAIRMLESHPFPGNVRELQNLVRHAVIISKGPEINSEDIAQTLGSHRVVMGMADAPATFPTEVASRSGLPFEQRIQAAFPTEADLVTVARLEAAYLKRVLDLTGNNVSKAARIMDLGRATMYRWMKEDADE